MIIVVLAACGIVYWRSGDCLDAFFHFDDFWVLLAADRIRITSLSDLREFFAPIHGFLLYRPLSTLGYFYALRSIFGHDPVAYHAVQLAVQVLNGAIVFVLADRLFLNRVAAISAALIYVLAPGHAIAACWNALFTMSGAALFYICGLLVWTTVDGRARGPLAITFFAMTLLASEHGVTFPLAISAATIFLYPRSAWMHAAWAQVLMYLAAAAYAGAKLYYVRVMVPEEVRDPIVRGIIAKTYTPRLDFLRAVDNLGTYLGFSFNGLNDVIGSHPQWRAPAAAVWLTWFLVAVLLGLRNPRWRVAAFGLSLFPIALAPVLFLPDHVYSYYVGIAGAGLAIALVATISIPRSFAAAGPAAVLAVCIGLFVWTTPAVRNSEEMRFFWSFNRAAARWLYSMSVATADHAVDEVVVPHSGLTDMVFREGQAHRVLLCATYDVRRVHDIAAEPAAPRRLLIREPLPLTRSAQRPWRWLRRTCR